MSWMNESRKHKKEIYIGDLQMLPRQTKRTLVVVMMWGEEEVWNEESLGMKKKEEMNVANEELYRVKYSTKDDPPPKPNEWLGPVNRGKRA
jgi:hypothetical protein